MNDPFSITAGLSSLVDGISSLFGGGDDEEPRRQPDPQEPEPSPVDYQSLFNDDPQVDTVIGSGPGGTRQMVRQPSLVEDANDPRFPAFQQAWRDGTPYQQLLGDEPFRLKGTIAGNGGDNRRPDVAKAQVLLDKAGYHSSIAPDEGPNGYHSKPLDQDIRSFQRANKLVVDGKLSPGGETIRTLERTLSQRPDAAPAEQPPKPATPQPGDTSPVSAPPDGTARHTSPGKAQPWPKTIRGA